MKLLKHKHFYDDIYQTHYVFLLNVSSDKQIESILKKHYPQTYKLYAKDKKSGIHVSIENYGGRCIWFDHRKIIIVSKMKHYIAADWYSILAHECLHAMLKTFARKGIDLATEENDRNEHFTYYLGMLMRIAFEKDCY